MSSLCVANNMSTYLFYVASSEENRVAPELIDNGYSFKFWKPSVFEIVPKDISLVPYSIWWLLHQFRVFANRGYSLFLIYREGRLVHRSCIFPKYLRFPFMAKNDLQVGDTWTDPEHRGQGLATFALQKILELNAASDRQFWYIVAQNNAPSIRIAEKAGFAKIAKGARIKRLGVRLLGTFAISEHL